jgi:hypothetical protein
MAAFFKFATQRYTFTKTHTMKSTDRFHGYKCEERNLNKREVNTSAIFSSSCSLEEPEKLTEYNTTAIMIQIRCNY